MRWSILSWAVLAVLVFVLHLNTSINQHETARSLSGALKSLAAYEEKLIPSQTNVHWLGHPLFLGDSSKPNKFSWAENKEIGLRGDGMVIWRNYYFGDATNVGASNLVIGFIKEAAK